MGITIEDVVGFLDSSKEDEKVKELLGKYTKPATVTPDLFKAFLDTPDGQRMVQPIVDRRTQEGIKTFEEGHFAEKVKAAAAAEVMKMRPQETEEQKQIRELREEVEKEKRARTRSQLEREATEFFAQNKIPQIALKYFAGNTLDEVRLYAQELDEWRKTSVKDEVNKVLVGYGHKTGSGVDKKDPKEMSGPEKEAYYRAEAEKRLGVKTKE